MNPKLYKNSDRKWGIHVGHVTMATVHALVMWNYFSSQESKLITPMTFFISSMRKIWLFIYIYFLLFQSFGNMMNWLGGWRCLQQFSSYTLLLLIRSFRVEHVALFGCWFQLETGFQVWLWRVWDTDKSWLPLYIYGNPGLLSISKYFYK